MKDTGSSPASLIGSWISKHPRVLIGVVLAACLGPFLHKAIHTDDPLYIWTAQWIRMHPTDFFGFKVNEWFSEVPMWVANWNPPLMSFFLAGVASLFGWSEIALHLGGLLVAMAAALGMYSLARRWCGHPLAATLVAIFMPAFLVSSTTLMCDVLMLAFGVWSLVLWEQALAGPPGPWRFTAAGLLAGLAVLSKYSAVTLLPLLPLLAILRTRKAGWWLLGLAVPLAMVGGYEWMTAKMYGVGLFSAAVGHTHHSREFPSHWGARSIAGIAFAGGCLLPLLFFAPWLWRTRTLLTGGLVMLGMWLALFPLWDHLALVNIADLESLRHWYYLLQVALLAGGGLHLLLLAAAETRRGRDIVSTVLALWVASGLFSAIALNFALNARSFLLVIPPAAILLVRRLEAVRANAVTGGRWVWPLIPAAIISLCLIISDCVLAATDRSAAEQIMTGFKTAGGTVWFEGHGGFQYYMEKLGARTIDVERTVMQPGDVVVVPWLGGGFVTFPAGSVAWGDNLVCRPHSWFNLMGVSDSGAAGFYGANWGPLPFALGQFPPQSYFVLRVFSRIQYQSQPNNPEEVRAGGVPSFSGVAMVMDNTAIHHESPPILQAILKVRELEREGKIEEAIRGYREVLKLDADSTVALNNLAWLLATTGDARLRDGAEAVRLARRALELTGGTQPVIITTLAVAFAQTGRPDDAVKLAGIAQCLSALINQPEQAAIDNRLLNSLEAGQSFESPKNP